MENYMDIIVTEIIFDLIKEDSKKEEPLKESFIKEPKAEQCKIFCCTCEACIDSMRAIALNNLKPFYTTSIKGKVYGTFENNTPQRQVQILTEVIKAIRIVQSNPKH